MDANAKADNDNAIIEMLMDPPASQAELFALCLAARKIIDGLLLRLRASEELKAGYLDLLHNGQHAPMMLLVLIESPLRGATASDTVANQEYARRAMRDSLARGECPFASHLLYAQPGVLDDDVPAERDQGIAAGLAWGRRAARTVVYYDRGVSPGMRHGIAAAREAGREIVWRTLDKPWPMPAEAGADDIVQV